MPSLETVVIGQPGPNIWNIAEDERVISRERMVRLHACQLAFTGIILRSRPKSICQHTVRGPYAMVSVGAIPCDSGLDVTTHFSHAHCPPLFVSGAINRLIYPPGVAFPPDRAPDKRFKGPKVLLEVGDASRELAYWEKGQIPTDDDAREVRPNIRVEIYGLCHPRHVGNTSKVPNDLKTLDLDGLAPGKGLQTDIAMP